MTTARTVTAVPLGDAASAPAEVATGSDGALWFTDPGKNAIGRFVPPPSAAPVVAAVLPSSCSVQVGVTATAFATIINAGPAILDGCAIVPLTSVPATFLYQTTDLLTNAPTGTPTRRFRSGPGRLRRSWSTSHRRRPSCRSRCDSASHARALIRRDRARHQHAVALRVCDARARPHRAERDAEPERPPRDPRRRKRNAFSLATFNLGIGASITVTPSPRSIALPLNLLVCQTNPATGQCLAVPTSSVTVTIDATATPTFSIFGTATGAISFDPTNHRIFVDFTDAGGATRGSSSVAATTE